MILSPLEAAFAVAVFLWLLHTAWRMVRDEEAE